MERGKKCFVCLSPPLSSLPLPALWTKCKAGRTELELTQSEKMVGLLKIPFYGAQPHL